VSIFVVSAAQIRRVREDLSDGVGCGNRALGIVRYLVETGADVRAKDNYALGMRSERHLEVVKYLRSTARMFVLATSPWSQLPLPKDTSMSCVYLGNREADLILMEVGRWR